MCPEGVRETKYVDHLRRDGLSEEVTTYFEGSRCLPKLFKIQSCPSTVAAIRQDLTQTLLKNVATEDVIFREFFPDSAGMFYSLL
jgi:hypothetical protein